MPYKVVISGIKHTCEIPRLKSEHPEFVVGTVIKCTECYQHWECTGFDSGMQHDPYPTVITWEKVKPPMILQALLNV